MARPVKKAAQREVRLAWLVDPDVNRAELARQQGVHRDTVRYWIKDFRETLSFETIVVLIRERQLAAASQAVGRLIKGLADQDVEVTPAQASRIVAEQMKSAGADSEVTRHVVTTVGDEVVAALKGRIEVEADDEVQ